MVGKRTSKNTTEKGGDGDKKQHEMCVILAVELLFVCLYVYTVCICMFVSVQVVLLSLRNVTGSFCNL